MKVSYNWLQDYVKTTLTPLELGERFLMTSSETEEIINWEEKFQGIVVGKVQDIEPHPNADRLRVATVFLGNKTVKIVCGAPNLETGQTVPVALPNATLYPLKYAPATIKETEIRGVKSAGMICAAEELGLALPSEGIMILPNRLEAGQPVSQALNLNDTVLDLEITPNRPDLLSYQGLAREVATFEKKRLLQPPIYSLQDETNRPNINLKVEIENSHFCPRYSAICLENIRVQESPLWLQIRLILSGIKPVNNIVDVTNYCMLELGQPMHAFDLDKLNNAQLGVRSARSGETLVVLDNTTRELIPGDLVITNRNKAVAIAGIIGGIDTAIDSNTTKIVLESANFFGPQIRRTSRRLGLRSEASTRFEKGLDPEQTITALKRALYLIKDLCSEAKLCSRLTDVYPVSHQERPRIHLSFARFQQITGIHISPTECKSILQKLGFLIPSINKSSLEIIPPSWRKDVTLPEDVIEELLRIWGYERVLNTLPLGPIKAPEPNIFFEKKNLIRSTLAGFGMHECISISLTSAQLLNKAAWPEDKSVRIPDPLSSETSILLPTHLAPLLDNLANQNAPFTRLYLFELGHVFLPPTQEVETLSILMRSNETGESIYRSAKTYLNRLFQVLNLGRVEYKPSNRQNSYYAENTALDIEVQNKVIGQLGLISNTVIDNFKIRNGKTLVYIDINLDQALSLSPAAQPFQTLPAFPSVERDLSLIVKSDISTKAIIDTARQAMNDKLVRDLYTVSIYRGKPLPEDKKSVTIHFEYNALTRTLEDEEVNKDQEKIIAATKEKLNAQVNE